MRVALIAPFGLRTRGTTRGRALPLGRALVELGHEVSLWIPPYDSPEDAGRSWQDAGVSVRNLPLGPRGRLATPVFMAFRVAREVRAWRPDVVHAFKPKGPSGLAALLLQLGAPEGRAPLVVDADDWEGAGGWNDDARLGYGRLERRIFSWQERYGLSHAAGWTVTSECLRQRAIGFGASANAITVVPNGVSLSDWPAVRQQTQRQDLLLYTRFAGVAVDFVREVWSQVSRGVPDSRLLVVGRGLAGEEMHLVGVQGVELMGWLDREARRQAFGRAAAAMAPWADLPTNRARSSVKVRELMAAGIPVVGSAVGELPWLLGDAGVVAPAGDARSLAEGVVSLLKDPALAVQLGRQARERVEAVADWTKLAGHLLRVYEQVTGRAGERRS